MKLCAFSLLLLVSPLVAMEKNESTQEEKEDRKGITYDAYVQKMFSVHFDRIIDSNGFGVENSETNGLLKASKIIQEQINNDTRFCRYDLPPLPSAFFSDYDTTLKDEIWNEVKDTEEYQDALKKAEEKTKEMWQSWLDFRKAAAYLKLDVLKKRGVMDYEKRRPNESREDFLKRFMRDNKDFDYTDERKLQYFLASEVGTYEQVQLQRDTIKKLCPEMQDTYDPNYQPHK